MDENKVILIYRCRMCNKQFKSAETIVVNDIPNYIKYMAVKNPFIHHECDNQIHGTAEFIGVVKL